jgi:Na+-translocating ferredoxin:NAD+ oxidoreductase RnfG subunit
MRAARPTRSTWGSDLPSRRLAAAAFAALALALLSAPAAAKVFHSRNEALRLAFPDAERIEDETYVLTDAQAERVGALASSPVDSRLVKIYRGFQGDQLLGYAVIDIHNVRTMPEAFMVVLTPEGSVRSVRVLAFHEPLDYLPSERWYEQFDEKTLASPLRLGGDIHGVVGATLSSRATTRGVRRALALYRVLVKNEP